MIQLVKTNRTDRSNKRRRVWLDGVSSCIIQKSARRTKQTLLFLGADFSPACMNIYVAAVNVIHCSHQKSFSARSDPSCRLRDVHQVGWAPRARSAIKPLPRQAASVLGGGSTHQPTWFEKHLSL